MIAPKINGEALQDISVDSHTQIWQGSFNNTLTITVKHAEDEGGPCSWGYVEYENGSSERGFVNRVIFRSDDRARHYTNPQDVINSLVSFLHQLRNVINYIK
jgi:hypothetical protein